MGIQERIQALIASFHRNQDGAVAMLCMAGLLIIFMTAMMMYDAGEAARDKMDVQMGSDTAALSHASVKARSMNMIAYSNITKRLLYGYNTIYIAAFLALIEATSYFLYEAAKNANYAIDTIPLCVTVIGCAVPIAFAGKALSNALAGIEGVIQLVLEVIELAGVTSSRLFGIGAGDLGRSIVEVTALDYYQEYIGKMSPWWAWGEAVTRGMRNGATLVGTWPIPNGEVAKLRNKIRFAMNALNSVFSSLPSADSVIGTTSKKDELPIEQIPELIALGPFFSGIGVPRLAAHAKLCGGMLLSPEFWLMQYYLDHWEPSEGLWDNNSTLLGTRKNPRTLVTTLELLQLPVGCVVASLTLGHEVLPYNIKSSVAGAPWSGGGNTKNEWLEATSNVAFGYKRGQGRFDDDARRSKLNFMSPDYTISGGGAFFRNDGYWSVSKAELMYDTGFLGDIGAGAANTINANVPGPFGSLLNRAMGIVNDWFNQPTMWAPRWTSRSRPLALPQEDAHKDMDKMFHDSLPFMALTTPLALAYGEGGSFPTIQQMTNLDGAISGGLSFLQNFARDVLFMEMASDGYVIGKQQSGWEK